MRDNKIKQKNNPLVSIIVILIGLFIGSLAFELTNILGYSSVPFSEINKGTVFQSGNRTWVAYPEPIMNLKILTDSSCKQCSPKEDMTAIYGSISPTIVPQEVDLSSAEGSRLLEKFSIKGVPAYIFDSSIAQFSRFPQIKTLLTEKDNEFLFDGTGIGLSPRKLLATPSPNDGYKRGNTNNPQLTIVKYGSLSCHFSAQSEEVDKKIIETYGDKLQFVYKHFDRGGIDSLASQAAECAGEQGKQGDMLDTIYKNQQELSEAKIPIFAASLGLSQEKISTCLAKKTYEEKIKESTKEGNEFGVNGTPTYFIGKQIVNGYRPFEDMKTIIEEELQKKS